MNVDQITSIFNFVRNELGNPKVSLEVVDFAVKFRGEIESFGQSTPVTRRLINTDMESSTIFVNAAKIDQKELGLYGDWATMFTMHIQNLIDPIPKPVFQYNQNAGSRTSIMELGVPSTHRAVTLDLKLGQAQNHFVSIAINMAWEMARIRRLPRNSKNLRFEVISPRRDFVQMRQVAITPRALELGVAAESPAYLGYSMIASETHAVRIRDELQYAGLGFRLTPLFTSVKEMLHPFANESTDRCKVLMQVSAEASTSIFQKWLKFREFSSS